MAAAWRNGGIGSVSRSRKKEEREKSNFVINFLGFLLAESFKVIKVLVCPIHLLQKEKDHYTHLQLVSSFNWFGFNQISNTDFTRYVGGIVVESESVKLESSCTEIHSTYQRKLYVRGVTLYLWMFSRQTRLDCLKQENVFLFLHSETKYVSSRIVKFWLVNSGSTVN